MGGTDPGDALPQVQYTRCALQDYSVAFGGLFCPRSGYPLLLVGKSRAGAGCARSLTRRPATTCCIVV